MIFQTLLESAERGELILLDGGMCRYHVRKDCQATIREIVVLPSYRRAGLGRRMIEMVAANNLVACIVARCPVVLPSNLFWESIGFRLVGTTDGLNTWKKDLLPLG